MSSGRLGERIARRLDTSLDGQLGYYPLALRLNRRHGFHAERMQPGHPNWMLDSSREGLAPAFRDRRATAWSGGSSARGATFQRGSSKAMRAECSALVLSNVQPRTVMPYLAAARRLGLPVVAYVASWDHTVGKGVISPYCQRYVVQNGVMEDDLRRFHDIDPSRVVVTGWPQTDIFHRRRPRSEYEALLRSYGLDPGRPLVLVMGNTPTNTPYEGRLVERLVSWWQQTASASFQLLFRPHPRDREWKSRFGAGVGKAGVHVQAPSYTDIEEACRAPAAWRCRRRQRGDDPSRRARQRPTGRVRPVRRRSARGGVVGREERRGKHYEELAASGAFYRAAASTRSWRDRSRARRSGRARLRRDGASFRRRRRGRRTSCGARRRGDRGGRGTTYRA